MKDENPQPIDRERPFEFKAHPNLSNEINHNIAQSEIDGGAQLAKLEIGKLLHVQTRNTHYEIQRVSHTAPEFCIQGYQHFCPVWMPASIAGSTWGGSMLKIGYVGIGMHLEFWIAEHGTITTTKIEKIWEEPVLCENQTKS